GALAMRCAMLLTGLVAAEGGSVDRVDGKVIECYPSAALYRFRGTSGGGGDDGDAASRVGAGCVGRRMDSSAGGRRAGIASQRMTLTPEQPLQKRGFCV